MSDARRWLWLYRPTVPTVRAQAIQTVHMAHAMASRGHEVTLIVEREGRADPAEILDFYGLEPIDELRLVVLPGRRTPASVAFRAIVAQWAAANGRDGVVLARSKRYARALMRWFRELTLVLEAHEVDSAQARERGEDPAEWLALEAEVLGRCRGVVTNCPGTLGLLREVHPALPPAIALQNGTHAARFRTPDGPGEGIGYAGSVRDYKDLRTLARAARDLSWPVHLIGADPEGARPLIADAGGSLRVEPAVPHRDLPDRLAGFRVLVLPLARGLFGERLSSPLKLWDYLAAGVPVVAADTPALRDAAPGAYVPYAPGDPASLADAIRRAMTDEALRAEVLANRPLRTWADRAGELEAFVESLR